jgi:hypothetical protein
MIKIFFCDEKLKGIYCTVLETFINKVCHEAMKDGNIWPSRCILSLVVAIVRNDVANNVNLSPFF